ncbi:MAG TPA: hypothetical protein VEX39_15875 [Thermoleophilaceae bacterium]|nr:hypothetical protein [Thermoleophilaceae bacterium]
MSVKGGETEDGDPLLLAVERSAGVAGRFARMRVHASGLVTVRRPPHDEVSLQLDGNRLARVRSLLTGAHFRTLSSSYFLPHPVMPDGYAWRISHAGVTVATRDGEAPRGLAALMRELAAVLDEAAFADGGELAR